MQPHPSYWTRKVLELWSSPKVFLKAFSAKGKNREESQNDASEGTFCFLILPLRARTCCKGYLARVDLVIADRLCHAWRTCDIVYCQLVSEGDMCYVANIRSLSAFRCATYLFRVGTCS